jgi:1-deoxy-D-xylulose-5-phosphate synthase
MSRLLDSIDGPAALKRLSGQDLKQLATEIREELVSTVNANGGHLASNLGVVELTIALHRIFDSPRDRILWDVGHQSYVHKLLTGRNKRFGSLRQYGGLAGFTERSESPHDPFGAGHASTSISAALGMAIARDLSDQDHHVVAVIGDGALTGGMAFEALNHAGHLGTKLVVILNDNGMAISPSVGALSRVLSRVRFDRRYRRTQEEVKHMLARLPWGRQVWRASERVKGSVKELIMPTMIWEELGFTYTGPIDGHNISELEAALAQARGYPARPTFLHVVTTKGKGYHPAEDDAVGYHGVPPPDTKAGDASTYSEVFAETVLRLAETNPRLVAVTAAMPEGTGLSLVARQLPGRVFDVGICEQHAVTFAAGLATQGFTPIVVVYSTFLQRAFDQVIHDVCIQNLPVVLALDRAGIVGEDGKTHQGSFDLSYLSSIPNMVVAAPKDENELRHLLYTAVKADRPMAIRYPRDQGLGVTVEPEFHQLPLGKGEIVRQGADVALLAIGITVTPAVEAAQELAEGGIEATVVNARFAKPLDAALILQVAEQTKRLITVEENALAGGFGSAVLQLLQSSGVTGVRVEHIGLPDEFVEQGPQALLRAKYDLDSEGISRRVLSSFPELAYAPRLRAAPSR